MNALAIGLHALAAVVWVGGMFFAYVVLRPSLAVLEAPASRLTLWSEVFRKFFPWVWLCILVLLASGYWLVFMAWNGFAGTPAYVHLMQLWGLVMSGLFIYLYYRPLPVFRKAVAAQDWSAAAAALARIRRIVGINLILGLLLVAYVTGSRYL